MINIEDYLLSIDEFNRPKVVKDKDAVFVLLVRLLLLEPGKDQSHPNMGIGIVPRYRYSDDANLSVLQDDCTKQINTYLPELQGAEVQLSTSSDKELNIQIAVDDTLYIFKTDSNTNTLISIDSLT